MLPDNVGKSPLEQLSINLLGGKTYIQETSVLVLATGQVILRNNPNRLAWSLINLSNNDVYVSWSSDLLASGWGWLLVGFGGVISSIYTEDGEGTGWQVNARTLTGNTIVIMREVIRE